MNELWYQGVGKMVTCDGGGYGCGAPAEYITTATGGTEDDTPIEIDSDDAIEIMAATDQFGAWCQDCWDNAATEEESA